MVTFFTFFGIYCMSCFTNEVEISMADIHLEAVVNKDTGTHNSSVQSIPSDISKQYSVNQNAGH